jgi:hypothetical protein
VSRRAFAALLLVLLSADGGAQTAVRRLTTIDALRQYPVYFHLQNVLVHGEFVESGGRLLLRAADRDVLVQLNQEKTTSGLVEVRGQFLDVGRLEPGDPRVASEAGPREADRWPKPGEELLLSVSSVTTTPLATSPSVRALALQPWRFEGREVTLVGQFRGRNLFGDLPNAPGKSRYDFVLRSADAAVWVTLIRPRGRGFDLNVDARVDTGRWLQVTGTVVRDRGLVTVEGTAVATTAAPEATPAVEEPPPPPVPQEPTEVVFSSPGDAETNVPLTSSVRVQFSRGLNPATIMGRIRVSYVGGPAAADPAPLEFQHIYDAGPRAIEIRFTRPLDPFRTVRIELLEGITAFDGAPLAPWTLTFSLGGG